MIMAGSALPCLSMNKIFLCFSSNGLWTNWTPLKVMRKVLIQRLLMQCLQLNLFTYNNKIWIRYIECYWCMLKCEGWRQCRPHDGLCHQLAIRRKSFVHGVKASISQLSLADSYSRIQENLQCRLNWIMSLQMMFHHIFWQRCLHPLFNH